jgi:hypothetical protein
MRREIFYNLTIEGHQELMLATIKNLKWQRDCLHEQLDAMEQRYAENGLSETTVVHEELEIELAETEQAILEMRRRLIRLRGYDEDGHPF